MPLRARKDLKKEDNAYLVARRRDRPDPVHPLWARDLSCLKRPHVRTLSPSWGRTTAWRLPSGPRTVRTCGQMAPQAGPRLALANPMISASPPPWRYEVERWNT